MPAYGLLLGFAAVAIWETLRPLRVPLLPTGRRWLSHGAIWFVNNAVSLGVLQIATVYIAMLRTPGGFWNPGGDWRILTLRVALYILLLDFARYAVHYVFHAVPVLWRIHQVHHADADFDATTGLRFHPLQAVVEQVVAIGAVLLTGPPPIAVAAFALLSSMVDIFVHANASSRTVERLGKFFITPDMHRLHHSTAIENQNLNFGFLFSWWDRLFRTYAPGSAEAFAVGLEGYQDRRSASFWRMLAMPVWGGPDEAAPATEPRTASKAAG